MSETWNADTTPVNSIRVGNSEVTIEGDVEADRVREVARENGVKKFKVEDEDGNGLDSDEFPYDGTVVVNEYNENA